MSELIDFCHITRVAGPGSMKLITALQHCFDSVSSADELDTLLPIVLDRTAKRAPRLLQFSIDLSSISHALNIKVDSVQSLTVSSISSGNKAWFLTVRNAGSATESATRYFVSAAEGLGQVHRCDDDGDEASAPLTSWLTQRGHEPMFTATRWADTEDFQLSLTYNGATHELDTFTKPCFGVGAINTPLNFVVECTLRAADHICGISSSHDDAPADASHVTQWYKGDNTYPTPKFSALSQAHSKLIENAYELKLVRCFHSMMI